jgi:hypothetical protein
MRRPFAGRHLPAPRDLRNDATVGVVAMALIGAVVAFVVLVVLPGPARSIQELATLDQCYGGWPVVSLEGDWTAALPNELRDRPPPYLPVAEWPVGLHFDAASGELRDASGSTRFRRGDLVSIKASIVEIHGDPSPCFYTYNVRIERIQPG